MRRRLLPLLLLLALAVVLLAAAPAPDTAITREEISRILDRFDHSRHQRALKRAKLSCNACHQVGAAQEGAKAEDLARVFMAPPEASCHACHNPSDGSAPNGPRKCDVCHDQRMRPASHGAGFATDHGLEARLEGSTCTDCHRRSMCTDCHARKDNSTFRVHDRSWLSIHGISARTNPADCGSCHLQAECVSCHTTGRGGTP